MKINTGKSHPLLLVNSRATATTDNDYIESEDKRVLLGKRIDSNLTFENHINSILQVSKSKVKCPRKNRSLHEYTDAKNNHEVICKLLNLVIIC